MSYGTISPKEGMRLVKGEEYDLQIQCLVDEEDGVIADAKFTAFGETLLIAAADTVCELALRKHYAQALRMGAELVEKTKQFPPEGIPFIHMALDVLDKALEQCADLPMPEEYRNTPVDLGELQTGEYPNWASYTQEERVEAIRHLLAHEVAPYIQLDDGNVHLVELQGDLRAIIRYEGACTTCHSATGSTLSAIQQILRAKLHPQLEVYPLLT